MFKQYYEKLASILPVANILHKLVPEGIITTGDIEEINDKPRSKEKASFILNKIDRSLEADANNSFYALLDIMEECGNDDVKSIVINMRRMLMTGELIVNDCTCVCIQACLFYTYLANARKLKYYGSAIY